MFIYRLGWLMLFGTRQMCFLKYAQEDLYSVHPCLFQLVWNKAIQYTAIHHTQLPLFGNGDLANGVCLVLMRKAKSALWVK